MRFIEDAAGIRGREVIPRIIPVTNPSAGAEWLATVPGGAVWIVQNIFYTLVSSAVVATRVSNLRWTDGSMEIGRLSCSVTQPASNTLKYTWWKSLGSVNTAGGGGFASISLPKVYMFPGWTVGTITSAIDVGDQYSAVSVYALEVEERPYDVEMLRDIAAIRGRTSNAIPEIREGL